MVSGWNECDCVARVPCRDRQIDRQKQTETETDRERSAPAAHLEECPQAWPPGQPPNCSELNCSQLL